MEKLPRLSEHLSEAQLHALTDGRAGEEMRLWASAHIAECDECMARYLGILEEEPLLAPAFSPAAAAREKRRRKKAKVSRFAMVLAAACLAVMMWGGILAAQQAQARDTLPPRPSESLAQKMDDAFASLNRTVESFFAGLGGG